MVLWNAERNAHINTASATTDAKYRSGYTGAKGKIGVYYNYCAASAGTYCTPKGSSSGGAQYDICPSGWKMPAGNIDKGSYYYLYNNATEGYGADQVNFKNALRTPLSGRFYNDSARYQGTGGGFWSSTRYDNTDMYRLYVDEWSVNPQSSDSHYIGLSVRCIFGS